MLATNVQYKSNILPLQEPPPPEPKVGERITYMRNRKLMTGVVWGTMHTEIKRYRIDGKHPIVCEFVVEVDAGQSPWKYETVHESDVMWGYSGHRPVDVKCQRCNDLGYLSINGDDACECPVCNPVEMEVTF